MQTLGNIIVRCQLHLYNLEDKCNWPVSERYALEAAESDGYRQHYNFVSIQGLYPWKGPYEGRLRHNGVWSPVPIHRQFKGTPNAQYFGPIWSVHRKYT